MPTVTLTDSRLYVIQGHDAIARLFPRPVQGLAKVFRMIGEQRLVEIIFLAIGADLDDDGAFIGRKAIVAC
jgi:hypothetical protein